MTIKRTFDSNEFNTMVNETYHCVFEVLPSPCKYKVYSCREAKLQHEIKSMSIDIAETKKYLKENIRAYNDLDRWHDDDASCLDIVADPISKEHILNNLPNLVSLRNVKSCKKGLAKCINLTKIALGKMYYSMNQNIIELNNLIIERPDFIRE